MEKRSKTYSIDIHPVPWARPAGRTRRYDAQKNDKLLFGLHVNKEHNGESPFKKGPLSIDITFYFKYPSASSRGQVHWYPHHPDIDNLEKFLYDTLKDCGVIEDDRFICQASQKKVYGEKAKVEFTITEL